MTIWWLFFVAFAAALLLTGWLRRYAVARGLLDLPNSRSSHIQPTPRGGGLAIVLAFFFSLLMLHARENVPVVPLLALFGAGTMVAVVGFLDDQGHVKARWRLLVHFLAASWGLFWLGGQSALPGFAFGLNLSWFFYPLAALYLVWLLNLYNFMDGIDGLAALEAVFVCLGGALFSFLHSPDFLSWQIALLLAASVFGFLPWNFPRARIFMGDGGSGFLGLTLGLFSLQALWAKPELFWGWLILLGVFVTDATVTLVRRIFRGERLYEAHRTHAYQVLSRRYRSHVRVTIGVLLINLCWLLPLALVAARFPYAALPCVFAAYLPLVVLAIKVDGFVNIP